MNKRLIFAVFVFGAIATICSGCGKKEGDEPTKYRSQEGLAKMTQQQSDMMKMSSVAKNPRFLVTSSLAPVSSEVKDLDAAIRPVLKNIFGNAKIVSESKAPETKVDGEVVENRFIYVVNKVLVRQDGKALHTALHAAGFGLSPRLGSEPTTWTGGAMMSLFKSTSARSYSLVINMDTKKQQIVVESYRLGSKYDRLM
ncbi:MAG: hypothetical protein NTW64_00050 [Candidatus Omnitrophica bacterium]|nr:hypothetical protein [Candidatus Omnitrophota bacterium]